MFIYQLVYIYSPSTIKYHVHDAVNGTSSYTLCIPHCVYHLVSTTLDHHHLDHCRSRTTTRITGPSAVGTTRRKGRRRARRAGRGLGSTRRWRRTCGSGGSWGGALRGRGTTLASSVVVPTGVGRVEGGGKRGGKRGGREGRGRTMGRMGGARISMGTFHRLSCTMPTPLGVYHA